MNQKNVQIETAEEFNPEIVIDPAGGSGKPDCIMLSQSENDQSYIINGHDISFGPISGKIVKILITSAVEKRSMNIQEIRKTLWLSGIFIGEKAIISTVSRIRKKVRIEFEGRIGRFGFIETIKGTGYKLNAEIVEKQNQAS